MGSPKGNNIIPLSTHNRGYQFIDAIGNIKICSIDAVEFDFDTNGNVTVKYVSDKQILTGWNNIPYTACNYNGTLPNSAATLITSITSNY